MIRQKLDSNQMQNVMAATGTKVLKHISKYTVMIVTFIQVLKCVMFWSYVPFPESKCGFLGVDCHVAAVVYSDGKMGLACGGSGGGYLWQDRGWLVGVVEVATCGKIGVGWG